MLKKLIEDEIKKMLNGESQIEQKSSFDNGMIGKYVIVRCRDAGVHAGILKAYDGRQCLLHESRRLWYWKVKGSGDFLSAIALSGVHKDSKLGAPVNIHLTENCEIIECTEESEMSIRNQRVHNG